MKAFVLPILVLGLAACEQESQGLPFDAGATTVTRTVSGAGGTVALTGRSSLQFPAGALSGPAEVTLAMVSAPAGLAGSGSAASGWYRGDPAGLTLGTAATAEVKFDASTDIERAWLTSLVIVTDAGVQEIGDTRVDLTTGIASAGIPSLGTFAAVIPPASSVFAVATLGAAAGAAAPSPIARRVGSDSVAIECGGASSRCAGISIQASPNLLDRVSRAAVVYPSIRGGLKLDPRTSTIRGRIAVDAIVRVLLNSGTTTASVPIEVADFEIDQRVTLPFPVGSALAGTGRVWHASAAAADGAITITVTDSVQIVNEDGQTENATVAISFPVQLY